MEVSKDFIRELKKRKEALVRSGGELDTEGLDEDVQELFRYNDDRTVEVQMARLRSMAFLPWTGKSVQRRRTKKWRYARQDEEIDWKGVGSKQRVYEEHFVEKAWIS